MYKYRINEKWQYDYSLSLYTHTHTRVHTHTHTHTHRSSPVAQMVKNLTAVQKILVQSLGQEDPLEKVRHSWATNTHIHTHTHTHTHIQTQMWNSLQNIELDVIHVLKTLGKYVSTVKLLLNYYLWYWYFLHSLKSFPESPTSLHNNIVPWLILLK